jgi:phage terminase small subunit
MTTDPARLPAGRPRTGEKLPPAPRHLTVSSRRLWASVVRDYALEDRHLAILAAALEARDRMIEARAAIERDGAYTVGKFGPKAHPGIGVERDSRTAMLRAFRELGLDLEAPATSRPPTRWRS